MASQTKLQDKVRLLELRNRDLVNDMEKVRQQEQNLRRRLNASFRPGAMVINDICITKYTLYFGDVFGEVSWSYEKLQLHDKPSVCSPFRVCLLKK